MRLRREGAALAELIVAMTLTALIAGVALGGLTGLQRTVAHHAERTSLEAGLRGAAQLIRSELRDAGTGVDGDLVALTPGSVIYRAVRGSGVACGLDATSLLMSAGSLRTLRAPVPGRDSLQVLVGLAALPDSLRWTLLPLLGAPFSARCPDGTPALAIPTPVSAIPALPEGAPVRVVELMELRLYQSAAQWWLGLRSLGTGETIQPAFGPFAAAGVAFRYLDRLGSETIAAAEVTSLAIVIRGVTSVDQGAGGAASAGAAGRDSMTVTLPLRNALP